MRYICVNVRVRYICVNLRVRYICENLPHQVRLDVLRQKDETNQSAVARCLILLFFNLSALYFDLILTKRDENSFFSPEVKRRLQEVILQRKRKEAASSMGNLQVMIQNKTRRSNKQNKTSLANFQNITNIQDVFFSLVPPN